MDARASLRIAAALAAALAAAAARPAAAPAQEPPPAVVEGRVTSRAGDPLAEVNVFLLETLDGALSDARGRFRFEARHHGAATLVVLRRGYLELRRPVTLPLEDPLALVLDERPVALAPLEVAAGRVLATAEPDAALSTLEVVTTPGAAADVYRALQTFAGLQAVDEGAGLFVRGGSPEETRVFLDEAAVLAPYRYESPTGGFFGTFDPFQLDGIVFSTGGFGARHGDALSGIADLRTLGRPSRTSGGASASLAALSGTLALALPHGLGVRGAATRTHTGLMFDLNGTGTDFTNEPEGRDLSGGVTWAYRPAGELRAFGMDQWSRLGVVVEDPSFTGAYEADERHGLYVASWRDTFERLAPVASVSTARTESTRELGALRLRTTERLTQAHARAAFNPWPLWTFTFGGDVERRRASFSGTVPAQGHDIAPGARRTVVASTVAGTRHALFGEADWRAANALRLTAGLRTDRSTLSGERTWDPRLAAALRLADGITLTAAWGVYHQVASPLAYEPDTGDPSLPPMRAEHRIAGALLERGGLLLRVEAYHKRYRDLAQQTRDYGIAGGGRGTSRGADVFARLTGLPGLEVLGAVRHRPLVIFTTAYDRFAVAAFELAAVDYLLKPFGAERLRAALDRAIDWLQRPAAPADERVRDTLRTDRPLERLFVRDRGRIVPFAAAAIERCEARDDYVAVHAGGRAYLVQVRLQDLERRLDPTRFVRIHRSHLVNLDFVQAFEPYDAHRLLVHMRDGARVLGSRTRSRELRRRMDL